MSMIQCQLGNIWLRGVGYPRRRDASEGGRGRDPKHRKGMAWENRRGIVHYDLQCRRKQKRRGVRALGLCV